MNKTLSIILAILITASLSVQCTVWQEPEISRDKVSRIIQTLSSDEMKGRHALSSEINKAADFISAEFNNIGLQTLPQLGDYRQSFTIYSISVDSARISIDGNLLTDNDFFALMDTDSINWNQDKVSVHTIDSGDKFRRSFDEYRNDDEHSLIIIDQDHSERFHRYRKYFSRPQNKFQLGNARNDLFILYNGPAQTFSASISSRVSEKELQNIAGMIEGNRSDEIILFAAHYDHIGVMRTVDGDSIGNGANDNASGTTAVIELARYFKAMPKPERTLYFVTFTGEELGSVGSKYFARHINPEEILAMFNIEMIGKSSIDNPNSAWVTGYDRSTFGELLQQSLTDSSFTFYPDPYTNRNLFYRSDNIPLARKGIPAHTISTTPIEMDDDYHTVDDEYSTINIPHLTNTIRAIARSAESMIAGTATPTRVDTTNLE